MNICLHCTLKICFYVLQEWFTVTQFSEKQKTFFINIACILLRRHHFYLQVVCALEPSMILFLIDCCLYFRENNLESVITVIRGKMEEVTLPVEKVCATIIGLHLNRLLFDTFVKYSACGCV